jgi:HD-GYP domain-containing protein (c-di-GMP phosphodiesterase class II)
VRSTHERFDGSGYPDALAGEQIPLGARIIAACDAYTAMTAPRADATRMTAAQAVDELRRCAGSHFDPQVVAVVVQVLAEQTDAGHVTSPTASRPAR